MHWWNWFTKVNSQMGTASNLFSSRSTGLNNTRKFFLALVLTIACSVLTFFLSKVFLIHSDFFGSIYENGVPRALAGISLFIFPYIHQRLVGKQKFSFANLPEEVVPFGSYTLRWYILLTYSILMAFAIAGISLFMVWLIGITTGFFVTRAVLIVNVLFLSITFYYLGYWIGSRSTRSPYLIAMGMVFGYTVLELLVSVVLNVDSALRSPIGLIIFLSLTLVFASMGALIGKRRRLLNYIRFLLGQVRELERQTLVDNLYWEIKRRMSDKH